MSETNFKFFIQFNFYTVVECIFSGIVIAYYLAKQTQDGVRATVS